MNPQGLEEFGATDPSRARLKRAAYLPLPPRGPRLRARRGPGHRHRPALEPAVRHHLGLAARPRRHDPQRDRSRVAGRAGNRGRRRPASGAASGIGDDETVLLSVGRLEENKGFHVLAAALAALRDHAPVIAAGRWRWVIVGDGPLPGPSDAGDSRRQARRAHAAGRSHSTMRRCTRGTKRRTLFVHPTLYEGSSLVTLEAMAHRRAVVASRCRGAARQGQARAATAGWCRLAMPPRSPPRSAARSVRTSICRHWAGTAVCAWSASSRGMPQRNQHFISIGSSWQAAEKRSLNVKCKGQSAKCNFKTRCFALHFALYVLHFALRMRFSASCQLKAGPARHDCSSGALVGPTFRSGDPGHFCSTT